MSTVYIGKQSLLDTTNNEFLLSTITIENSNGIVGYKLNDPIDPYSRFKYIDINKYPHSNPNTNIDIRNSTVYIDLNKEKANIPKTKDKIILLLPKINSCCVMIIKGGDYIFTIHLTQVDVYSPDIYKNFFDFLVEKQIKIINIFYLSDCNINSFNELAKQKNITINRNNHICSLLNGIKRTFFELDDMGAAFKYVGDIGDTKSVKNDYNEPLSYHLMFDVQRDTLYCFTDKSKELQYKKFYISDPFNFNYDNNANINFIRKINQTYVNNLNFNEFKKLIPILIYDSLFETSKIELIEEEDEEVEVEVEERERTVGSKGKKEKMILLMIRINDKK
jgi:hypothetical protein